MDNMGMEPLSSISRGWPTSCAARITICSTCQPFRGVYKLPPITRPLTDAPGTQRALFDFPTLQVSATGERSRVIVATHPAAAASAAVGETREGMVYELFFTALPVGAFTAADVVDLYLGRGAFETVLADEDQEQDADRWCSHTPCGQEFWQILCQW